MAKRIVDEEMRFSVVINGNEAQKELFDLEKSTRDLTKRNKELREEKRKLSRAGKKETAEYKALDKELRQNNRTLKEKQARMSALQKEIGVTGLTMNQLSKRASQLRLQLHNMVPGSAQYNRYQAELKQVDARLKELRMSARATRSSIGRIADGFNRYAALGASVIATGTGMVLSIQKVLDYNSKLSDSQADVRKTTGLTKEEVDDLTKSFGAFTTRSTRQELLKLAEEAGRLGITGVKNLQDYVQVANQLKVALGDDLSDEAIREVGKMTNVYKVGEQTGKDFAQANMALGSSINEVSASGANNAQFLVDYLKRQAGVAAQTKVSADQNIGYAATFDEIGQSAEISATAMNKVWIDMFENTDRYAKIANMTLEDFSALLKTDANQAMIAFLKGLNGANGGMEEMVEKLSKIDVGGARGVQALSALANNTELLQKRQETAAKALEEATSLTEEYEVKNNNLAATLQKVQKRLIGFVSSEAIVQWLQSGIEWFAKFIGASEDASGEVTVWRNRLLAVVKVLAVVLAAVLSYNAALKLTALWTARASAATKIHYALLVAQEVATKSLAIAKALLTGNIKKAVIAYRALTAAMALNPIGAALAVVGAAVAAYYAFAESAEKAATKQSLLSNASKKVANDIASEKNEVEAWLTVARDADASREAKLVAIKKLNQISPEYLGNLNLENIATKEGEKALKEYTDALERASRAKALKAMLDEKTQELIEQENSSLEDNIDFWDKAWAALKGGFNPASVQNSLLEKGLNTRKENIEATKAEIAILKDLYAEQMKENTKDGDPSPSGPKDGDMQNIEGTWFIFKGGKWVRYAPGGDGDTGDPKKSSFNPSASTEEKNLRRIQEENNRLIASLIDDSFKKEIAQLEANHQAKLTQIKEQMIEEAQMRNLDLEIDKARAGGDDKRAEELSKVKETWVQRNRELNQQIQHEEAIHQNELGTIIQKGLQDQANNVQEQFEREQRQRQIAHNVALAALGNDKKARAALQEQFNREEAEREAQHLNDLLAQMQGIIDNGEFKGFDLELLSEEEKQQLLDFLDELGIKLSEIKGGGALLGGGEEGLSYGGFDILGFSVDQWDATFENLDTVSQKIEAAQTVVQGLMNAWGMYQDFQAKKQQVELQNFERTQREKEDRLRRQLDTGRINQRQYNRAIEEMEKETQRKRAEMEYKAAKREKEMMMAQIVLNTAAGVAKAMAQGGFVLGVPWAAVIAGLGAVQLGLAAATPLPAKGYEEGLYPVQREQDGKMFNASYGGETRSGMVNKPTLFLAGEGGQRRPEMIIDDKAWKKFDPALQDTIHNEIARVKGFETGYYKRDQQVSGSDVSSQDNTPLLMVVSRAVDVLDRLEQNGVIAYLERDMENARKMDEDIKEYNKWRNSNKK
ncbi:phage tail tape measure protein [Salegentibacter sp. BDJ18]|uniref:phage tail tape measure protein n=1 Tax=Salegentibacter sp. BDJ18 TaxID=2816376 RepID=UPI001AAFD4D9|nr:phage tail tape measure protein [Salegentibacter sp. BDJ18]MBO2546126.1 phage tail tape measure protein [Salegentibacter sp. BDJ18]